jgi:glycosyltransferase involved in cell wall biosynthesis
MKIAFFTETFLPKIDGIVTRLTHTLRYLQDWGHELQIYAPETGITAYRSSPVIGVSAMPFPLYPELKLAMPKPFIKEKLQIFQPDIIHVVNPAVLGWAGIQYSKELNVPLLASYHTHLPQYLKHYHLDMFKGLLWQVLRTMHNKARRNLCTSAAMHQELAENGIEHLAVWQRGVDTELFHPDKKSSTMRDVLSQGQPQAPLLLYVGRLGAEKRLEQLRPLLTALPGVRLALVGDGPQRGELEKLFADLPVFFAGYLRGEDLAAAYASADLFVFPSTTETLGLVLLEAMAAGCPAVAANSGGIPDIISDGVNGLLFPPEGGIGMAVEKVRALLNDSVFRETLRQAAVLEARRWSWEAATRQLLTFYEEIRCAA